MRNERRAVIVLAAALAVSACHTAFGPDAIDRNWSVHEGPRVSFFVRPGSFAEQNVGRLTEVLEDQFTATVVSLGLSYAGRLHAYAYDSAADASFSTNYSDRAYPQTESFRFVCVPPVGGNLFSLMSHEANHVLIINGLGRAGTYFMTEGLASAVVTETFHRSGRHFLFPWTRSNRSRLPRLATLVDDGEWQRMEQTAAYNASASFLAWLLDMYGPDRLRQVYGAPSEQFRDRLMATYGLTLESLEAEWLRFTDSWVG